jgi:hypothetical protein
VREQAGNYYDAAVSTRLAWASPDDDPLCLPRLEMFYFRDPRLWRHFNDHWGAAYVRLRRWGRSLRGEQ